MDIGRRILFLKGGHSTLQSMPQNSSKIRWQYKWHGGSLRDCSRVYTMQSIDQRRSASRCSSS